MPSVLPASRARPSHAELQPTPRSSRAPLAMDFGNGTSTHVFLYDRTGVEFIRNDTSGIARSSLKRLVVEGPTTLRCDVLTLPPSKPYSLHSKASARSAACVPHSFNGACTKPCDEARNHWSTHFGLADRPGGVDATASVRIA